MTSKVIYYDDEITKVGRDAQRIQALLREPGVFECDLRPPPKSFADLPQELPDALLVDFDLSSALVNGEFISYFGSTLASEVRMRKPNCPISLVTRKEAIGTDWQEQLLQHNVDVDLILLKDEITRNAPQERAKIVDLIDTFKALEYISIKSQPWEGVLQLMDATDDEADLLKEAAPPVVQKQWNVPQTARWIRDVVLGYPGILYDELTAATRLGISLESFRADRVQELVAQAKYTGALYPNEKRWWRNRLFNTAQRLILEHDLRGPVSQTFGKAFKVMHNQSLEPAICIYDKTPIADWVCYVLQKPVKQQNSIPYYPDQRPGVMDQARVSFKAIQESNAFDENLVDSDGYEIVSKLWE